MPKREPKTIELTFRMSAPLLLTLQEIANLAGVKLGDVVSVVMASEVVRSRRATSGIQE